MALFKSKQTQPESKTIMKKKKQTQTKIPPNREILSSNLKKVLAIVETQDQKQLATAVEKLKRSKIDFEFQLNIAVKRDICKLGFHVDRR